MNPRITSLGAWKDRGGRYVLNVQYEYLPWLCWWRKPDIVIRHFLAAEKIAGNFWKWLELPCKTLVGQKLEWQLDAWLREAIIELEAQ